MGLFDKKYCDVCGEKIGLLGNRKLEDGNLCKDCAGKLSPWFSGRRHSALTDIKSQLAYREDNKAAVAGFHYTRKFGKNSPQLFVDENNCTFAVCSERELQNGNPDIISISSVTDCHFEEKEYRNEVKYKNNEGQMVSYNPPRYEYSYDYYMEIYVDHPYIDEIRFKLNDFTVKQNVTGSLMNLNHNGKTYIDMSDQIQDYLLNPAYRKTATPANAAPEAPTGNPIGNPSFDFALDPIVYCPTMNPTPDSLVKLYIRGKANYTITNEINFQSFQSSSKSDWNTFMHTPAKMAVAGLMPRQIPVDEILSGTILRDEIMKSFTLLDLPMGIRVDGLAIEVTVSDEDKAKLAGANAAPAVWKCPACDTMNKGKFCEGCGFPKPQ